MISSNIHNVRSASVSRTDISAWVTLHLAGQDRVSIHCRSPENAAAIAAAFNADANLNATMAPKKEASA